MRPLERSLEKLDDVRRKKLSEMISGSEDAVPGRSSAGFVLFIYYRNKYIIRCQGENVSFGLDGAIFVVDVYQKFGYDLLKVILIIKISRPWFFKITSFHTGSC